MKIVTFDTPGKADILVVKHVEPPSKMSKSDLYIKQVLVGVNFTDILMRRGDIDISNIIPDRILGLEGIGIIEKIGSAIGSGFSVGQRIGYCLQTAGAYSQKRTLHHSLAVAIPDYISDDVAGSCLRKGLFAYILLFKVFKVTRGSTIMIHGVTGGVGHILAMWASYSGIKVIGTVENDVQKSFATEIGCSLVINRKKEDAIGLVRNFTNGLGVNAVYDGIGVDVFDLSISCLGVMGIYIQYESVSGQIKSFTLDTLINKSLFITAPTLEQYCNNKSELILSLNEVFAAIRKGAISPRTQKYSIDAVSRAHEDVESGMGTGSVVLIM